MRIPRTPNSRLEGLKGYDFAPHHTGIADPDGIGRWLAALDLKGLTLFWQGWGAISIAQVANTPERFVRGHRLQHRRTVRRGWQ